MQLDTWIYYTLAILVLTASPGPSSLLCLSKGVSSGFRLALTTALGSLSAITIILTLSFTGLGVVIASSEFVFNIIKWCGAAYLIWLGIQAFRSKQTILRSPTLHRCQPATSAPIPVVLSLVPVIRKPLFSLRHYSHNSLTQPLRC